MKINLEAWSINLLEEACQELMDALALWESRKADCHPEADTMLTLLDEDIRTVNALLEREKQYAAQRVLMAD